MIPHSITASTAEMSDVPRDPRMLYCRRACVWGKNAEQGDVLKYILSIICLVGFHFVGRKCCYGWDVYVFFWWAWKGAANGRSFIKPRNVLKKEIMAPSWVVLKIWIILHHTWAVTSYVGVWKWTDVWNLPHFFSWQNQRKDFLFSAIGKR